MVGPWLWDHWCDWQRPGSSQAPEEGLSSVSSAMNIIVPCDDAQCYPDYILLQWVGLLYYTCAYWESTWAQNSLKSCACLGYKDINSGLGNWAQIAGDRDGALPQSLALCSSGSYSIPWVSWFFWSDTRQPFFCVTFSNKKILQSVNRLID